VGPLVRGDLVLAAEAPWTNSASVRHVDLAAPNLMTMLGSSGTVMTWSVIASSVMMRPPGRARVVYLAPTDSAVEAESVVVGPAAGGGRRAGAGGGG